MWPEGSPPGAAEAASLEQAGHVNTGWQWRNVFAQMYAHNCALVHLAVAIY